MKYIVLSFLNPQTNLMPLTSSWDMGNKRLGKKWNAFKIPPWKN